MQSEGLVENHLCFVCVCVYVCIFKQAFDQQSIILNLRPNKTCDRQSILCFHFIDNQVVLNRRVSRILVSLKENAWQLKSLACTIFFFRQAAGLLLSGPSYLSEDKPEESDRK